MVSVPNDPQGSAAGNPPAPADSGAPKKPRSRFRKLTSYAAVAGLAMLLVGGAGLGTAEYYTAKPQFCGTCHVMDPYYQSWSHDVHGEKLGAKCVDCHYAPGERFTIKAKFKGLSQVASYFSGRYGAARPRAHVNDDSCLTSGCHGDGAFVDKDLPIGEVRTEKRQVHEQVVEVERTPTVHFVHAKHLNVDDKLLEVERALEETVGRLRASIGEEQLATIRRAAKSVGPAADRILAMKSTVAELGLAGSTETDARTLMDLEHRRIRVHQLSGLHCASCHMYDPSGSNHIAVDRQACYTCHFTHEEFNRNTGECLACHEAPTRKIAVHDRPASEGEQPVLMDHKEIVDRKVDCASCHADVIRGDARVTARECTHCHDQGKFLDGFDARDIEKVQMYHTSHAAAQRARCTDCHRSVQHGLLEAGADAMAGGFLKPVLNDCQHCHPNHHTEQVALLTGTGGAGVDRSMPNSMTGSRLNCRACHTEPATDSKGEELVRATQEGCLACHTPDYLERVEQWRSEIESYLKECEAQLARVEERVAQATSSGKAPSAEMVVGLDQARQNIRLVRVGAGIHNRPYALQLLDVARMSLDDVQSRTGQ